MMLMLVNNDDDDDDDEDDEDEEEDDDGADDDDEDDDDHDVEDDDVDDHDVEDDGDHDVEIDAARMLIFAVLISLTYFSNVCSSFGCRFSVFLKRSAKTSSRAIDSPFFRIKDSTARSPSSL